MVFGLGNNNEKDVESIDEEITEIEKKLQSIEGERRAKKVEEEKKRRLKQKKRELKKEEFKQTSAGKVLSSIGNALDQEAEETKDEQTSNFLDNLAKSIERVDGDGKNDSAAALGIGLQEKGGDKQDLVVEGDLEVEGKVDEKDSGSDVFEGSSKKSRTGTLSDDMKSIIGADE